MNNILIVSYKKKKKVIKYEKEKQQNVTNVKVI